MERYLLLDETPKTDHVRFDLFGTLTSSDEQTHSNSDDQSHVVPELNDSNPFRTKIPINKGHFNNTVPQLRQNYSSDFSTPFLNLNRQGETVKTSPQPTTLTMENALLNITSAFNDTLRSLNNHYNKPNRKPARNFSGFEHDDPAEFIDCLEYYFLGSDTSDEERVCVAASLLQGEARKWFEPYISLNLSWASFREQFLNRFNQISVIASATSTLYGQIQSPKESVSVFISKKIALFNRLDPNKTDQMKAAIILELLRPELRSRLRRYGVSFSCEELMSLANSVEKDLAAELNHFSQALIKPDFAFNQSNRQDSRKPPSPCKYCQDWHYNKDCPKNPYKSGNQQEAGQGQNVSRSAQSFTQFKQENWRVENRSAPPRHQN